MPAGATNPSRPRWITSESRYLAELVGLSALAFAQPVLDVFGKAPDVFVFRAADPADIYLFALVVAFGPPLFLWLVTAPWRLAGPTPRRWAHLVVCTVLVAAFVVLLVREIGSPPEVVVGLAAVGAAAAFLFAYRVVAVRTWLAFVALAAPVFAVLFLVSSPTAALLDDGPSVDAADARPGTGSGPPVVMLVLDELPLRSLLDETGMIDRQMFPNLAGLADDSVWYRNATTTSGGTWHAVPTLLTGRDPVKHEAPTSNDHPDNLFTALAPDYRVQAFEMLTRLCPTSVCEAVQVEGLPSGVGPLLADSRSIYAELLVPSRRAADPVTSFLEATVDTPAAEDEPDGDVDPGFDDVEANQPARYAAFLDGLDELGPASPPTFNYLHLLLPHTPWRFYPTGVEYEIGDDTIGRSYLNWSEASPPVDVARQRHLLQLAYADRLVGGVVDRLKERGIYDDVVIAVASDHGTAFTPGGSVRGTAIDADIDDVLADLMWVPLLIKAPGLPGGTVTDENVETTDVVPTIAELAGVDLDYDVDGRSLVSGGPRTSTEKAFRPVEMSQFGNILGSLYTIDASEGLADTLADNIGLFLPDRRDAALRPYRLGPFGRLVGESVVSYTTGGADDDTVVLETGLGLQDSNRDEVVDSLVSGHLASGDSDTTVAVALNGIVAGVGETYDSGPPGSFVVLAAEPFIRDGSNDVTFYRVDGAPDAPRLVPLPRQD